MTPEVRVLISGEASCGDHRSFLGGPWVSHVYRSIRNLFGGQGDEERTHWIVTLEVGFFSLVCWLDSGTRPSNLVYRLPNSLVVYWNYFSLKFMDLLLLKSSHFCCSNPLFVRWNLQLLPKFAESERKIIEPSEQSWRRPKPQSLGGPVPWSKHPLFPKLKRNARMFIPPSIDIFSGFLCVHITATRKPIQDNGMTMPWRWHMCWTMLD